MRLIKSPFVWIGIIAVLVAFALLIKKVGFSHQSAYVKVKVSQGLWWAATQKPPIWMVNELLKNKDATVQELHIYPWESVNQPLSQYDLYLTLKLPVSSLGNNSYIYNRTALMVGAPIDFNVGSMQLTGVITALSPTPFQTKYETKTVELLKHNADPWEFDAITVGDTYNDGFQDTFTILDKKETPSQSIALNVDSPDGQAGLQNRVDISVTARIVVSKGAREWVYGSEVVVKPGKLLHLETNKVSLDRFFITAIR